MNKLLGVVGAIALALLTIMLTVSFGDARANGASYLAAIGITGVPRFLQSSAAGLILAIASTATLTWIVARWWFNLPQRSETSAGREAEGPSAYELYSSMDDLISRMSHHLEYAGFGLGGETANAILMDCNSLNITLQKAGYEVPYVPSGELSARFNLLGSYYGQVGPLLRDGHIPEARAIARQIATQHPLPAPAS